MFGPIAPPVSPARPRLLFLVTEDRFFWSHRLPIARAALRSGYEVIVATNVLRYEQEIQNEGFRLIPLRLIRKSSSPLNELRALHELRRIYDAEKPDIVHHFAVKPVLYGSIAALGRKDMQAINALTGLGYLVASSSMKARLLRPIIWRALRFLLNRPDHYVLLQNQQDKELAVSRLNVSPEKITVIRGSGVNVNVFRPSPEPDGSPIVLLAARMLWIKGIREFAEAARLLRVRGVAARFVLAGDTDPSNPSCVPRQQILAWQDSGAVEWWGHQQDMPALFGRVHLVCLPSHGGEGVPKVLLEAAGSGRAIITTHVPGCGDIVRHGVNGLLVEPRNAVALADAVEQLLLDQPLRLQMGRAGRHIAVAEFSEEGVVRETLELYRRLLQSALP